MSSCSSRTGYRSIPSASKGSGAGPGAPPQPTQAPESTVRMTDSIAVTSPPGLVTHSVAPSGRVRESTGSRLATTTSWCPASGVEIEVLDGSGDAGTVSSGTVSPSRGGGDVLTLSSAIAHPAGAALCGCGPTVQP